MTNLNPRSIVHAFLNPEPINPSTDQLLGSKILPIITYCNLIRLNCLHSPAVRHITTLKKCNLYFDTETGLICIFYALRIDQMHNHQINRTTKQSVNQPNNQSITNSTILDQNSVCLFNCNIIQEISQSMNQSSNQSINRLSNEIQMIH